MAKKFKITNVHAYERRQTMKDPVIKDKNIRPYQIMLVRDSRRNAVGSSWNNIYIFDGNMLFKIYNNFVDFETNEDLYDVINSIEDVERILRRRRLV